VTEEDVPTAGAVVEPIHDRGSDVSQRSSSQVILQIPRQLLNGPVEIRLVRFKNFRLIAPFDVVGKDVGVDEGLAAGVKDVNSLRRETNITQYTSVLEKSRKYSLPFIWFNVRV
jgi:hypothetical protein